MGNHSYFKKYWLAGMPLIFIGIIINPWLISWLFSLKFPITMFSGLLAISLLLIIAGWGFLFKKEKFIPWFGEKYRDFAVILLNLILLFGIINVIATLMIRKPAEKKRADNSYFYSPQELFKDSSQFLHKIYEGKSEEDIQELLLLKSPYANHPILEFQERIQSSKHYNVGSEGIRLDFRVNRLNATKMIDSAVWVFGGSTTFGQGVSDNETIPAFLNMIDSSNTYINFGVHAYHQTNEIDKLLLLLKKGYKPKKVIFIDGLNDLVRMIETNFHPLETPALAKSAYISDYNIATRDTRASWLMQLPITRLLRSYVDKEEEDDKAIELPWNKYDNVYDPNNLYNTDPKRHFTSSLLRSPYSHVDTAGLKYVIWKLKEFYSANYIFLSKLAQAYDFEFSIYYQPLGVLSSNNPFWRDQKNREKTPLYRNFQYVVPAIREQLATWNLPGYHDISSVQDSCPDCYVDLTHYNPTLNRMIANTIIQNEGTIKSLFIPQNKSIE